MTSKRKSHDSIREQPASQERNPGQGIGEYAAARRETLAEVPGLRVRLLTLLPGQCVPWHYHSNITDTFFCMRGPMRVLTRVPGEEHILENGDTLAIAPGMPHFVEGHGVRECHFMIIQGVGEYDYIGIDDDD